MLFYKQICKIHIYGDSVQCVRVYLFQDIQSCMLSCLNGEEKNVS